jgi:3-hydroxyisobutyrate dehydrogenase-like beta-hydroxyacid dehydrogenase
MQSTKSVSRVAIIGFGEAGGIFANDLALQGINVLVFDILFHSNRHRRAMLSKAQARGVTAAHSLKDCLHKAELVISAVTASSALDVAKAAGPNLSGGQIFVDINSVSPETKRKAARYVERSKARFVEAAVMSAVPKQRLRVPMLLGGVHAAEVAELLQKIGMTPSLSVINSVSRRQSRCAAASSLKVWKRLPLSLCSPRASTVQKIS